MNHPTFERNSADKRISAGCESSMPHVLLVFARIAPAGGQFIVRFGAAEDVRTFRLTQSRR